MAQESRSQLADDEGQPSAPYYRRVSEVIRDPSEWNDLPQVEIDALEGAEIVVHDVMFLRGTMGERSDMDYAIILFGGPTTPPPSAFPRESWAKSGIQTSMCGGAVFVRKLKQLNGYGVDYAGEPNQLPMLGRVIRRQGSRWPTPYYDFV